jgi:UDP-glucose 4-epimerase
MTDSPSEIVYVPYEQVYGADFEDIRYRVPDISKLRQAIDYEPTVPLDEILRRVIDYERARLGKTPSPTP